MKTHLAGAKSLRPVPCVLSVTECSDCQVVTRHSGAPVRGRWLLLLPRGPSRPLSSLPLCFSAPFKPALSPTRFPEPFPVPVPGPRPRSGLVLRLVLCCRLAASYSSSGCRCIERCFHLGPRAPDRGPERPPPPPAASRGLSGLRPPPSLCFSSFSLQRFSGLCVGPFLCWFVSA